MRLGAGGADGGVAPAAGAPAGQRAFRAIFQTCKEDDSDDVNLYEAAYYSGKSSCFAVRQAWIRILAVTVSKWLYFSSPVEWGQQCRHSILQGASGAPAPQ